MTTGRTPFDEPTTINRDDLPSEPEHPHRHVDTDLRPGVSILGWPLKVAVVIVLAGLLWWFTRG